MSTQGRIFSRGPKFWIAYYVRGKEYREPGGATEAKARKLLQTRLREIYGDRFVGPEEKRITIDELLENLLTHLKTKGAKSIGSIKSHLKPVRARFALTRAVDLTSTMVEQFIAERMASGKARATANREVQPLKQAFNLARKQGRLTRVPYFPLLKEDNARQGFFEKEEFETVVAGLPDLMADIAWFAYLSAWRKGEIVSLPWSAVDRKAREVRLRTSKSGYGRVLPLDGILWEVMERRWAAREYLLPNGVTALSEFVFHSKGRPILDFGGPWARACKQAGLPDKLFHDLRRTAVRNMIRAGVPQSVAMDISGHRTISMFLRYNITSDDDRREAIRKSQNYVLGGPAVKRVLSMPPGTTRR